MKRPIRTLLAITLTFGAVAASHAPAQVGQPAPQQQLRIPKPVGQPKATPIMTILTAILVGGVVVIATLLPSKRGHQD